MPPVQRVTAFAESPGNTVTSCEVWLVCGCGNSLVWFESGMSCIFLPTDRGSQEMSRFPFALGEANPVSAFLSVVGPPCANSGVQQRVPSQPAQHRHVAGAKETHFK